VTSGRKTLPEADGRRRVTRRFRDIASAILNDQAGAEQCSESRKQLIRRFAAASVLAEEMESRLARGEEISIAEHALLCSTLVRVASRLGIDRRNKDVTPDPLDYARQFDISEAAE
jgi:ribosomal protein L13E